ncbi:MAG: hypothetical protein ACOC2F_05830 [Bacteroidota bacterium]
MNILLYLSFMPEKIAKIISYIFHPLLMPTYALLVLFNSGTYLQYMPQGPKAIIILLVFTGTFLIPVSLIPVFLYLGLTRSVYFYQRSERFIPLLITTLLYYFTFFFLRNNHLSAYILSILLTGTISLLAALLISVWWKISLHMIGIGALVGYITGLIIRTGTAHLILFIVIIFIAGLLGTARLVLKVHTGPQIYTGLFLGIITGFSTILLY